MMLIWTILSFVRVINSSFRRKGTGIRFENFFCEFQGKVSGQRPQCAVVKNFKLKMKETESFYVVDAFFNTSSSSIVRTL